MTKLKTRRVGMLWYDADPMAGPIAKIDKAVDYYRSKYKREPNLILVHPSMLDGQDPSAVQYPVRLQTDTTTLPRHVWVGIETER